MQETVSTHKAAWNMLHGIQFSVFRITNVVIEK